MGFGAPITSVLSNYVGFQGRARRSEYWWWILAYLILAIVAGVIDNIISPPIPGVIFQPRPVTNLLSLALFLPSLAVAVRRLHDTDRSGLWFLLIFLPIIGWLVLLYWYCQKGTSGQNRFGADPTA